MSTYLTLQGKSLEELPEIPTNFIAYGGVGKVITSWQNNTTLTGTTLIPQLWDADNNIWTDVTTLTSTATTYTFTGIYESSNVRIAVYVTATGRYYPSITVNAIPVESPVYTFTATTNNFEIPNGYDTMIYYVVAGGGGGGCALCYTGGEFAGGGGGGAGGVSTGTTGITAGFYNFVIGSGGVGATDFRYAGGNGGNSYISGGSLNITATGGGYGGCGTQKSYYINGSAGGSGGGGGARGGYSGNVGRGANGIAGQGNNGADGIGATGFTGGGGGGKLSNATGITGGTGFICPIDSKTYAVGGMGGKYVGVKYAGTDAAANTGNGGGGAAGINDGTVTTLKGGNGGSGIIIVRLL